MLCPVLPSRTAHAGKEKKWHTHSTLNMYARMHMHSQPVRSPPPSVSLSQQLNHPENRMRGLFRKKEVLLPPEEFSGTEAAEPLQPRPSTGVPGRRPPPMRSPVTGSPSRPSTAPLSRQQSPPSRRQKRPRKGGASLSRSIERARRELCHMLARLQLRRDEWGGFSPKQATAAVAAAAAGGGGAGRRAPAERSPFALTTEEVRQLEEEIRQGAETGSE